MCCERFNHHISFHKIVLLLLLCWCEAVLLLLDHHRNIINLPSIHLRFICARLPAQSITLTHLFTFTTQPTTFQHLNRATNDALCLCAVFASYVIWIYRRIDRLSILWIYFSRNFNEHFMIGNFEMIALHSGRTRIWSVQWPVVWQKGRNKMDFTLRNRVQVRQKPYVKWLNMRFLSHIHSVYYPRALFHVFLLIVHFIANHTYHCNHVFAYALERDVGWGSEWAVRLLATRDVALKICSNSN